MLAVSVAGFIQADEVWVTFGSGKNMRYIPAYIVAKPLGTDKASALPVFHALTGCDTVSFFGGRGKNSLGNMEDLSSVNACPDDPKSCANNRSPQQTHATA